jgi:hypothetical protein
MSHGRDLNDEAQSVSQWNLPDKTGRRFSGITVWRVGVGPVSFAGVFTFIWSHP